MGPRRLGLLQARTSMPGSRLDPEWSQDGPFIDPWDTTQVARGQNTSWRASPTPASAEDTTTSSSSQGRLRQVASPVPPSLPLLPLPQASPVLVPLVPLSVLVLLGSWVLQVRDIGKVILFRKP